MDAQIEKVIAGVQTEWSTRWQMQIPTQVLRELAQRVGEICADIAMDADTNWDAKESILAAVRSLADAQKGKTT